MDCHGKGDCSRLVEILNQYPLRGRKSRDYAIWSAAVGWWVADDARRTYPGRDKSPIVHLKQRLHEVKKFSPEEARRVIRDDDEALGGDWPGYISGLFTAEGSLGIFSNGNGLLPKSQLRMRCDDRPLLFEVSRRMSAGRIYHQRSRTRGQSDAVGWIVCGRGDLSRLVEVFDEHPPRGRKLREYAIWREAVLEYANRKPPAARHVRLSELQVALVEARTYRAPAEST